MVKIAEQPKKVVEEESLTPDEEKAIEEGRLAYIKGDWKDWNIVKRELENSSYRPGRKKH